MRNAEISRRTTETDIELSLELDGTGVSDIDSGCGFMDHMLTLLTKHGGFDLSLRCTGDARVDYHHSVEDIGICLGDALRAALGDMAGVKRFAHAILPMDEALVLTAIDVSGRGHLEFDLSLPSQRLGDFDTELVQEFFAAFARRAGITLHVKELSGANTHHIVEAAFKSLARSLREAVSLDPRLDGAIPSTKGML